jgi:putative transposase
MSKNAFRYFKTSPSIIQLGVLMHVRFPLSLRNAALREWRELVVV